MAKTTAKKTDDKKAETAAADEKTALPFVPKKIKAVTRNTLKLVVDQPAYVRITSLIEEGKEIKGTDKEAKMQPARVCEIINLVDGTEMQLVCGAIVESNLNEAYEDDAYVGKCFEIVKRPKASGKRYFPYDITEIEDPAPAKK